MMFPKPVKRKKSIKRLRPVSKRLSTLNYSTERKAYLNGLAIKQGNSHPKCEIALLETGCFGDRLATQIHHIRGRIGKDEHGTPLLISHSNFLGSCSTCHEWVEQNRKQAIERGFSKPRNHI